MIEQLKAIQTGLAIAIDSEGFVDKPVRRALLDAVKAAAQLEAMVGSQEPVGEVVDDTGYAYVKWSPALKWPVGTKFYTAPVAQHPVVVWERGAGKLLADKPLPDGTLLYAVPVAQQPQEIEVQCPVCNHKFYEWPNDKQPQAEAVPLDNETKNMKLMGLVDDLIAADPDRAERFIETVLARNALQKRLKQPQAEPICVSCRCFDEVSKRLCADKNRCFQAVAASSAPQQAEAVPSDVTDAMVEAYLKANDAYWRETDTQPKSPTKWRNGNPKEATRVSLAAAIAQQKGQP